MLTNRQRRFFEIAKKVSRLSRAPQFKFGVLIARRGKIISLGTNNPTKTHPASKTREKLIHAEFNAVINAREPLKGTDIYIWRSGHFENQLIATPCNDCMNLLRESGIRRVFHTVGIENNFGIMEIN